MKLPRSARFRLRHLRIDRVDSVDAGANPLAHISIAKHDHPDDEKVNMARHHLGRLDAAASGLPSPAQDRPPRGPSSLEDLASVLGQVHGGFVSRSRERDCAGP